MAPPLLIDLSSMDLEQVMYSVEDIEAINPHRGVMRMLDGVIWTDDKLSEGIAFRDIAEDEFWVAGHIPGRPLFPAVLMLEAAAQFASFMSIKRLGGKGFLAFTGVDEARFRGQVTPGKRMYIIGKEVSFKPRRFICQMQGVVDGELVFDTTLRGMPI